MIKMQRTRMRGIHHLWNQELYIGAVSGGKVHIMPHLKKHWAKLIKPNLPRSLRTLKHDFTVPFANLLPLEPPKPRALPVEDMPVGIPVIEAEGYEAPTPTPQDNASTNDTSNTDDTDDTDDTSADDPDDPGYTDAIV